MKRVLVLATFALVASLSWSQDYPRLELAAGYSYGSVDAQGYSTQRNAQGWSGSFTANMKRWVGLEAEVSGRQSTLPINYQGTLLNVDSRYFSFLAGPHFAHRTGKVTPFVHALFGVDHAPGFDSTVYDPLTGSSVTPYVNGFAAATGGGFDYALSRRLSFRSQADYFFTQHPTSLVATPNNFRIQAAIVFTFGQTETIYANNPQYRPQSQEALATLATSRVSPPKQEEPLSAPVLAQAPVTPEPATTLVASSVPPMPSVDIPSTRLNSSFQAQVAAPNAEPKPERPVALSAAQPASTGAAEPNPLITSPNTVLISQAADPTTSVKTEESLGEIARRYRESKRNTSAQLMVQ